MDSASTIRLRNEVRAGWAADARAKAAALAESLRVAPHQGREQGPACWGLRAFPVGNRTEAHFVAVTASREVARGWLLYPDPGQPAAVVHLPSGQLERLGSF
jgi:hypothetical protein